MISQPTSRRKQREKLLSKLNELQGATASGVEDEATDNISKGFFLLLAALPFDLLPYTAISQFVYRDESEDLPYFIEALESIITEKYSGNSENVNYKKGIKLIEHMELAQQQKDNLFEKHEKEIQKIKSHNNILMSSMKQTRKLKEEIENLQDENKRIITNFISILGVFAAILMGAFGAIQGFTSLFANAHKLELGIIMIISSIGASSVLLILFFLLNGIAKLTDKSLSSTSKENGTLIEKHPTLIITHGILITVSLIGASLKLSNIRLYLAYQGLWWILPCIWIIYFIVAINKKSFSIISRSSD